jgi:hypothetical protein
MLGPILLPREAEPFRQQLAEWASADRTQNDDFTVDCHKHRTYEVSKIEQMVKPLLRVLNREVRYERENEELC